MNIYAQEQRAVAFQAYFQERPDIKSFVISQNEYKDTIADLASSVEKNSIFCSSDSYALDILRKLKKINKKVPEDIGLMGFDNIDFLFMCFYFP
jgi:DNA-binding LacI/PurR family transcriptional regulator